jgi:hypothetical protein
MMNLLFAFFSLLPISFIAYVFSERLNATLQSRVGKAIGFTDFLKQTWTDSFDSLKNRNERPLWILLLLQYSILFFVSEDVEYAFIIYLVLNFSALSIYSIWLAKKETGEVSAQERVITNRAQVQCAFGALLAFLSAFASFSVEGTTSLAQINFSPFLIFFLIPFQIAGMLFFGEYPFEGFSEKREWILSARFYVWSMVATQLFLGGGFFFLDFHLKAAGIFILFRLVGVYFPRYQQKDFLRLGILYLVPVTVVLWLVVMIAHGVLAGGFNA